MSAYIICSEKRTVFRERSSRKTVSYEEHIMTNDKYPSVFSPQMEAIMFIILQIFFATRAVLKIGECSRIFHSFRSRDVFRPIAREQKDLMDYKLLFSSFILIILLVYQRIYGICSSLIWLFSLVVLI